MLFSWRAHVLVVLQCLPISFVVGQRFEALNTILKFLIVNKILECISLTDAGIVLLHSLVSWEA
jgi:hypothetical protein